MDPLPGHRRRLLPEENPERRARIEEQAQGDDQRYEQGNPGPDPPGSPPRPQEVLPSEIGQQPQVTDHGGLGGGLPTQSRSPPCGTLRPTSVTKTSSSAAAGPSPAWAPSSATVPMPRSRPSWMTAIRVQSFSTTSSTCDV